jgi:hypothetical protein
MRAVGMIAKEGLPALRRRPPSCRHVLCDRGLSDIDAKLEQLAVYPRCAPRRICDAHLANEAATVCRCLRPATARSGFPAPIGSETTAVLQGVQHPGSQAIEPNKQQAIDAVEGHSLRRCPPQDLELVAKHKDFGSRARPSLAGHRMKGGQSTLHLFFKRNRGTSVWEATHAGVAKH